MWARWVDPAAQGGPASSTPRDPGGSWPGWRRTINWRFPPPRRQGRPRSRPRLDRAVTCAPDDSGPGPATTRPAAPSGIPAGPGSSAKDGPAPHLRGLAAHKAPNPLTLEVFPHGAPPARERGAARVVDAHARRRRSLGGRRLAAKTEEMGDRRRLQAQARTVKLPALFPYGPSPHCPAGAEKLNGPFSARSPAWRLHAPAGCLPALRSQAVRESSSRSRVEEWVVVEGPAPGRGGQLRQRHTSHAPHRPAPNAWGPTGRPGYLKAERGSTLEDEEASPPGLGFSGRGQPLPLQRTTSPTYPSWPSWRVRKTTSRFGLTRSRPPAAVPRGAARTTDPGGY